MSAEQPLVTIYIPSRNYGKYLNQAINSVVTQTFKNWELIIVDEASSDNTCEVAKAAIKKNSQKISLIKNKIPLGLQKIANKILGLGNGKYMMRLDADDWLDENALLCMVNKLEKNPDAGIVFSGYFYTDEKGNIIGTEVKDDFASSDLSKYPPPHGACTMFRSRVLKSAGGYLEAANAQDGWDLWYKLIGKIEAEVISIPLFYYRQHSSSLSKDNSRLLEARKEIFSNLSKFTQGDYIPKIAAVLPVKENYDFIEGIPFKKFGESTLLENAIKSVQESNRISELIITSKSKKVLTFIKDLMDAGKIDNVIIHERKKDDHEIGNIRIKSFFEIAIQEFNSKHSENPDILIYLSLHAILRRSSHIDQALDLLKLSQSDSVVSVKHENEALFKYGSQGLEIMNPGRFRDLSFERERIYRFNGAIIAVWTEILKSESLLGSKINFIEMTPDESLQINTPTLTKLLD